MSLYRKIFGDEFTVRKRRRERDEFNDFEDIGDKDVSRIEVG